MAKRVLTVTTLAVLSLAGLTAAPAAVAGAGAAQSPAHRAAAAATLPSGKAPQDGGANLSSTPSPSWQTDGTVWTLAVSAGVEYVGGDFTSVRPPGAAPGTGTVGRTYLAAFDTTSGDLLPFSATLNGEVTALAVSPDGSTLYAGGSFTSADGQARDHLAAFDISTGNLSSTWTPTATGNVLGLAVSPDGSEIYVGGGFGKLDGVVHDFVGAVSSSGTVEPWNPVVNGVVKTIAVAPDDSRVLIGGWFSAINGVTQQAIASTDPTTGASDPWAATIEPNEPKCLGDVKDIIISGQTAYIASEGTGGGCFDGDFAAAVSTGALIWMNDCLGATQAVEVVGGWLYKGSHAHDCAYEPGGFPEVASGSGWVTYHLLDQSLTDGTLGHWTPNTNQPSSQEPLGPGAMATDGTQLFVGGNFTTVNGQPQQGLTRFGPGPGPTPPNRPKAPTLVSTSDGVDSVTVTGVSSPDVGTLTYSIYRDGATTPIATLTATSWPWALPVLHYRDAGLTPGTQHTYQVQVSDGTNMSAMSPKSAPVTVSASNPPLSYVQTVLTSNPQFFWQLDETSGSTVYDSSPSGYDGLYRKGTTLGQSGPITGSGATAVAFDGITGTVNADTSSPTLSAFSVELWFETTTNKGGLIAGFCNQKVAMTSSCHRPVYMMNDGQVAFGVWYGKAQAIVSPDVYNDGQWHYLVATFSPTAGMALYVDGTLVGTNSTTNAGAYNGYWRLGSGDLNGWNLDHWKVNSQGTTEPYSYYFAGTIGDVAVYPEALDAPTVAAHYAANALSH